MGSRMKTYLALLRGINVGGNNKIAMSDLKQGLLEMGFLKVKTYLNSGNVTFESTCESPQVLSHQIQTMIQDEFGLSIPVYVTSKEELTAKLAQAPAWWGTDNPAIYDNLIFMLPPLTFASFYAEMGEPNTDYEQIAQYEDLVFWSFSRQDYQKTNWWAKTTKPKIKNKITIRTANTVRKVVK